MESLKELMAEMEEIAVRLKPKQKKFVEALERDGNATKAAIAAGYTEASAATQGWRLLRNEDVLAYRRIRAKIQVTAMGITKDTLIADLVEIKERFFWQNRAAPSAEAFCGIFGGAANAANLTLFHCLRAETKALHCFNTNFSRIRHRFSLLCQNDMPQLGQAL